MNLLIMGGPGAGKGTMSAKIVEKFKIAHISTGNIFRNEIKNETVLGLQAKSYLDQGYLVPDEVTNPMVKSFLEKLNNDNGYLLDGYPRTLDQATVFDELTKDTKQAIDAVISLEMPLEALFDRIAGRRLCKSCDAIYHIKTLPSKVEGKCDVCGNELYQRIDDTKENLEVRLEEYKNSTEPVLAYYESKGLLIRIDANQVADDVWIELVQALEAI